MSSADSRTPGVYTFEFYPTGKDGPAAQTEVRAFAFNLDSAKESDLRRAARDKLERSRAKDSRAGTILLRSPGDTYEAYKNKMPDASESPWLYLFFLVILIVEQALAVHLSFHLQGNEAAPGQRAAAAAGGGVIAILRRLRSGAARQAASDYGYTRTTYVS